MSERRRLLVPPAHEVDGEVPVDGREDEGGFERRAAALAETW
jgi:hypothetical protein